MNEPRGVGTYPPDPAVDLVFMSMVWHHLRRPAAAAAEVCRVLSAPGVLCVRTSTAETLDSYLYLRFFPAARRINEATLPTRPRLLNWALAGGFIPLEHVCIVQEIDRSPADYCARIQRRGLSDLVSIPDEEFASGLASLHRHCRELDTEQPVLEAVDLFVFHH